MKIEKLPSGSYRIRKQFQGKMYTVIVDYKPTQKQALELITEQLHSAPKDIKRCSMTFYEAYIKYIELKSNILSPSTKRGYKSCINAVPEYFRQKKIYDIEGIDVQKLINDYSSTHSPKSTKNLFGFISVILKTYRENIHLNIHLPQKIKSEPYIPTDDEVKSIMAELKGTKYFIPTALATMGMRKSEICALELSDLSDDNKIIINKALVKDENGNHVIKTTKTTESTREIYIPDYLADMIRKQGYVYNGFPDSITRNLSRVQDRLGIQHFPLHKLRHFFVSYAHNELHLSDKQIMDAGGWKSTAVMSNVYMHSMKQEEAKKKIADQMGALF